jgi:hypothetical protein
MRLTSPQLTRQAPQKTHNPLAKCMLRSGNFRTTMPPPPYKLFHRSEINFVFSEKKIIQKNRPYIPHPIECKPSKPAPEKQQQAFRITKFRIKIEVFEEFICKLFDRSDKYFANKFISSICDYRPAHGLIATKIHYSGPSFALLNIPARSSVLPEARDI